jgi:hypothetical protein
MLMTFGGGGGGGGSSSSSSSSSRIRCTGSSSARCKALNKQRKSPFTFVTKLQYSFTHKLGPLRGKLSFAFPGFFFEPFFLPFNLQSISHWHSTVTVTHDYDIPVPV